MFWNKLMKKRKGNQITKGQEENFSNLWPKEFEEFWKELLQTEGKWDEEKIKNELHDLVFTQRQVEILYMTVTDGKLSKPNYYAGTILSEFNEQIEKSYNQGYEDAKKDYSK